MNRTERLRHLWDESAREYANHARVFTTHRAITHMLVAATPQMSPSRILDIGCGPGNSTEILSWAFPRAHVVGLDYSDAMIRIARDEVSSNRTEFHHTTLQDYARHITEPFDLVVYSNSFFHVDDKEAQLESLKRVTNTQSAIVFSLYESVYRCREATKQAPDALIARLLETLSSNGHVVSERKEAREIFTPSTLETLFKERGLEVQQAGELIIHRSVPERLSFFSIPVVADEVFPDVPPKSVRNALEHIHSWAETHGQVVTRSIFMFRAQYARARPG
jgi:trans-aconitate methyltransferase